MVTRPLSLRRDDLIVLRNRYDTEQRDYLNFCYQYLNFYTGLLVTILGATIAGMLQINQVRLLDLVLLIGPVLVIVLASLGYSQIRVFYRRFIEARVNNRNIEEMLGDIYAERVKGSNRAPLFLSKHGGFIARFTRPSVQKILMEAKSQGKSAEDVITMMTNNGDTLSYARITLSVFVVVSVILMVVIFGLVLNSV